MEEIYTEKEELKKSGHSVLIEDPSADNGYSLSLVENNGERTFITIDGIETMWRKNWCPLWPWCM